MLLRYQPAYPGTAYVRDHERLLEALERRDPRVPDLFAVHLRLSARLICGELSCETREGTRASREEERAMAEEERRIT